MAKLGCFNCPEAGHDNSKEHNQKCPKCGYNYGFPIDSYPLIIDKYNVIKALFRGFYGATYVVKDELLDKEYVIKIIPVKVYEEFNKDFVKECREHADLAKGSQHIVGIVSMGRCHIDFQNGIKLECHFQVLEYIEGPVLKNILESENKISSIKIIQIAIDLFRILDVLKNKNKNHNDLHSENLIVQHLPHSERRADEVDNNLRVVAIDIGSLSSQNKVGDTPDRMGDIHWVANYLIKLSEKLLSDPDKTSDLDYRIASLLEDRAKLLFPSAEYLRAPNFNEVIEDIKICYRQQSYPWEEPLRLINFNDTYNAQTLDPWYVPSLLVDPDDQWLSKISGRGPLVITGMRGCGKTMMLRALQFHARAAAAKKATNNKTELIKKLSQSDYVGIYVSCSKLLGETGGSPKNLIKNPFSKLFIRYGIEAIKALRHLYSISPDDVKSDYFIDILDVFNEHLSNKSLLDNVYGDMQLEQKLLSMIYSLNRGEDKYIIKVNPVNAFPALAQTIRKCSTIWVNSPVLFLLDDVSTRYISEENIKLLLSSLIFQSEECAFKITSEIQSIKFGLYSPGIVERAKRGRDFETFDLGNAVNNKIRNKGGKQFVIDILNRRAKSNIKHPPKSPLELLGDTTLKSIATNIVSLNDNKKMRKQIYHGLTALNGVCVGDIGDIINLYDLIIRNYDFDKQILPIPAEDQNNCFLELCSIRLHEVNNMGSDKKDFALSFAEASHQLLVNSSKNGDSRLRQYYSIYVRITTGDQEWQYNKVRDLLDAGIFVYSGGVNAPRSLGNDSDPIRQFKLNYRKLYGVSTLIGLTQGDRFELSGDQVERWLKNPSMGKDILMENLGGISSNVDEGMDIDNEKLSIKSETSKMNLEQPVQAELIFEENMPDINEIYKKDQMLDLLKNKTPSVNHLQFAQFSKVTFDFLIAGLGFEERTLTSIRKLLKVNPKKILLIKYDEVGKSNEIIKEVLKSGIPYEIISYSKLMNNFDSPTGQILCDITGLSKSLIFNVTRNVLKTNRKLWICHTEAETYYPLNEEIEKSYGLFLNKDEDNFDKLNSISQSLISGESGPYEVYDLLYSDTDESKRNILIGFCETKYERLFKIIENRNFDKLEIITQSDDSIKGKLSNFASEIIFKSNPNTDIHKIKPGENINNLLDLITLQYQKYYIDQNFNFEIALTGSKEEALISAIISSVFKVSHCWYIKPNKWNTDTFSKGVGQTSYLNIKI